MDYKSGCGHNDPLLSAECEAGCLQAMMLAVQEVKPCLPYHRHSMLLLRLRNR